MGRTKKSIFRQRLTEMQDAANDAMQDYTPGFQHVPDGGYEARINAEIRESSNGNLMIAQTYTIIEGEYEGYKLWSNIMLEKIDSETQERIPSYNGIVFSRRWLESMGIDYPEDDLGLLEEIIEQINECAPACKIRSRTSKSKFSDEEFTNISITEMLDWGDEESGENDEQGEGEQGEGEQGEEGFTIEDLLTFAASQGIDTVDDNMSEEDIVAEILTYQFKANELTAEEKTMLLDLGIPEEQIIEPKPKRQRVTPPSEPKNVTTKKKTVAPPARQSKSVPDGSTGKKSVLPSGKGRSTAKTPPKSKSVAGRGRIGIRKK